MMNPFLLGPRERLKDWKAFRQSLDTGRIADTLQENARYWAQAPLSSYAYDAHDPESWPGIWEMITAGDWCDHSVAIGMWHTLHLAGIKPERMVLLLINDHDISEVKFVLQIDGTQWLNYHYGSVIDIPPSRRSVMCAWRYDGKAFQSVTSLNF